MVGESPRSLHGIQQSFQETKSETPNRAKPQAVTTRDSKLTEISEKVTREAEMEVLKISICFKTRIKSQEKRNPWCIQTAELALCELFSFSFTFSIRLIRINCIYLIILCSVLPAYQADNSPGCNSEVLS